MAQPPLRALAPVMVAALVVSHGGYVLAQHPSVCTVEVYGDSIMASNGSNETPVATLQRIRPNLRVLADHSVGGMPLHTVATYFPYLTIAAHFVIIQNGVIDAWQGENINTVMYDYTSIVRRVRDEGRIPVLTGFPHQVSGVLSSYNLRFRDFYDSVIRAVALNANVAFADWDSVPFYGAVDLLDTVHPNREYSHRLIGRLAQTLDAIAPGCTAILVPPA
ncbi:SGNH/GDSL hydrolase family protein [Variovorax saccharolyticus]|uniref:SGNH/GDSL hydrolase family protein n=1 Tax=Variovorax saccharolyticus TaxID=3053516 RepID=UPI002575E534|nr:SGNH/GDSL hydrolase family protein [Variovorax sp. J22R187]MDM0021928.1 SGNH/GDSL hydrolase family protein [Variovorax sp. J22R187]